MKVGDVVKRNMAKYEDVIVDAGRTGLVAECSGKVIVVVWDGDWSGTILQPSDVILT